MLAGEGVSEGEGVAWLVTGSHDSKDLRVGMRSPLQPHCRKGAPGCLPAPLEEATEPFIPSCLPDLQSGHPFVHCCPLSEWQGEREPRVNVFSVA